MSKKNEIKVIDDKSNHEMLLRNEDNKVEFYPEISQQSDDIIKLGTKLISEAGKVTVEYFKVQVDMYYEELNAFISNQKLKSDDRKIILQELNRINDHFMNLIDNTDDINEIEKIKQKYNIFYDKHAKSYLNALTIDSKTSTPKPSNLLSGLKRLFSGKSSR